MNDVTAIQSIRSLALARINDLMANPKPDYSIDGQTVSWSQHYKMLQDIVTWANKTEQQLDPYELRGTTM